MLDDLYLHESLVNCIRCSLELGEVEVNSELANWSQRF